MTLGRLREALNHLAAEKEGNDNLDVVIVYREAYKGVEDVKAIHREVSEFDRVELR